MELIFHVSFKKIVEIFDIYRLHYALYKFFLFGIISQSNV